MGEHSESRGGGPVDRKLAEGNCSERACHSAAATSLDQHAFCLNHFFLRCYARLEAVDPRGQKSREDRVDRKSTRLNSSHGYISYAVFCLKKKKTPPPTPLLTACPTLVTLEREPA